MAAKLLACVRGCCFCLPKLSNCLRVREVLSARPFQSFYLEKRELICCQRAPLKEAFSPFQVSGVSAQVMAAIFHHGVDSLAALLPRKLMKLSSFHVADVSVIPTLEYIWPLRALEKQRHYFTPDRALTQALGGAFNRRP